MRQSVAAIALFSRDVQGQTLWLAQWNEGWQAYSFVGGHRRDDESFRDCAVREIGEELGLNADADVLVGTAPVKRLQYEDVSRRTGEPTDYTIELFHAGLAGDGVLDRIAANPANCWLTEEEIMAGRAEHDTRPVSPTPKRFLRELGWDLFVSYAHADDHDGWVTELVQAVRAEHAEFSPAPLRVFFDRRDIRTMDDWQLRIYDGLCSSRLMLAVLSEKYFASAYCRKEWEIYVEHETVRQMRGETIAPIYIVTVAGFEEADEAELDRWRADLRRRQFEDVRRWRPDGVAALRELEVRQRLRSLDQQIAERLERVARAAQSKTTVPPATSRFVGRQRELALLRETLPKGKVAAITALHGIGGIGKTALAFMYSHAFADHYPGGRFLVEAAGLDDLQSALVRLAPDLDIELTEAEQQDPDLAAARVRRALESRAQSLVVLDNVEHPELLLPRHRQRVLPHSDRVHVLVTTRLGEDRLGGVGVECLALESLPENDAVELLHRYRVIEGDDEWKAALRIARLLGGHALALEVVAVFLWKHPEIGYGDYLSRLEGEGVFAGLTGAGRDEDVHGRLSHHPETLIGPLLEPTLAGLEPVERRILEHASLLPPDDIPLPWLSELAGRDFPELAEAPEPGYPDPAIRIWRRLAGLRLLVPGEDLRLARMHRVVQQVVAQSMEPGELAALREQQATLAEERGRRLRREWGQPDLRWELAALEAAALRLLEAGDRRGSRLADDIATPLAHTGRLVDVRRLWEGCVTLFERLASAAPENADYARDLSVSYERMGDLFRANGDAARAREFYEQALQVRERLASAAPENADYARDLSVSYNKMGDLFRANGDAARAREFYEQALQVAERLASAAPENADYARDLSVSYNKMGDLFRANGDAARAREFYEQALQVAERLASAAPENADYARDLSVSYERMGDLFRANGDAARAREFFEQALQVAERLASAAPENADYARDLSVSYNKMGDLFRANGDAARAREFYEQDLAVAERLASAAPENADYARDLSVSYNKMGDLFRANGDAARAREFYEQALQVRERLASAAPENADYARDLSVSYERMGDLFRANGDAARAREFYEQALQVSERLASAAPENADYARDLSVSYNKMGDLFRANGDAARAREFYEQALQVRERLASAAPENADYARDLWVSYWRMAQIAEDANNDPEALAWWTKAYDTLNGMQQRGLFISAEDQQFLPILAEKTKRRR